MGHQYLDESILEGSRLDIRQEHFQKNIRVVSTGLVLTRSRNPLPKHGVMIRINLFDFIQLFLNPLNQYVQLLDKV